MKIKFYLFFCTLFNTALLLAQSYEVIDIKIEAERHELKDVNSKMNEFSPFFHNGYLYFTSDSEIDKNLLGENNWNKEKQTNLFRVKVQDSHNEINSIFGKQLVSEKLRFEGHTGPASASSTGDSLFLSIVKFESKALEGLKPYIYLAEKNGKAWHNPTLLHFIDKNYIYTHPHYDSKSKRLYFTANIPGGKGGFDIYYSELQNGIWNEPVNLEKINSPANEVFPNTSNGIVFFSSDRNANKGLDLFWATIVGDDQVTPLSNINTDADDFGIFVLPNLDEGYMSSAVEGNDNLYYLKITKQVNIKNRIEGEFAYREVKGDLKGITVQVLDENDFVLYETKTDDKGRFVFEDIQSKPPYVLKVLSDDYLDLTIGKNGIYNGMELYGDENNKFLYRKLNPLSGGTNSLIPEDMIDFELNQGHLSAQLIYEDNQSSFPSNFVTELVDSAGNVFATKKTDKNGNFDFDKIPMDKSFLLKIPEATPNMILLIYNLKGNVVAQLKTNEDGEFVYRKVNPNYFNNLQLKEFKEEELFSMDNQTVWGYFDYKNKKNLPKKGLKVSVYDEYEKLISNSITDDQGLFRFRDLPTTQSLLFKLEETDGNFILDDFTMYIYDRYGVKIAVLSLTDDGFFKYRPLGFVESNKLSTIEEESMDFILGGDAKGKIVLVYFDSDQRKVKASEMDKINKLIEVLKKNPTAKIEINAYADAMSSDEYNLELSGKRGEWIVNYMSSQGIKKERMIVNAYGESLLIDEENHALNRRAEIRFY